MNYHLPRRSRSLRDIQAARDSQSPSASSHTKSPSLAALHQPAASKYQLWPSAKSPVGLSKPNQSSDKFAALSAGRSSTSLSDTAVLPESSLPFWQRTGSLSRRRKVSVPELGSTMTTVQEMSIDSRPSHVPAQIINAPPSSDLPNASGRPLSPILSPGATPRPYLKVQTASMDEETRPQVPPKSPAVERKTSPAPLILNSKTSRSQMTTPASTTSGGNTPLSAMDLRRSPNGSIPLPTPPSTFTNPFYASSPASNRGSPRTERRDPIATQSLAHNRNMSESSIMERGRPKRRNSKRERSRTVSEADGAEAIPDSWKLPEGMRVSEAARRMSDADKKLLHKQAYDQAGNFEVLHKRDVASLSRELRALDERCDYLRKTYKSLRAGRQKLHGRMIAYLRRGETVIFSRESLLKQEEALAELDISIDEFILKLEQAENRRLRLRQKLLEHVAAAIVLNPSARDQVAETTPPRSPVKVDSPSRHQRKETESIKIYADGHVLNLFSDIEKAIGKMCEQTC
ncbi:unnamed protein product [Alternaria alternata]